MSEGQNGYAERWSEQPPLIVFEDDDVRVIFKPGGSEYLLVTFGDAISLADGTRFHADFFASNFGIACLGFMAKAPNWFPAESMQNALPSIEYTLSSFRRVVTYGCSMGGYAALKYSRMLHATDVMAFCPQWSIDPAECGKQDSGFIAFFNPAMRGMGLKRFDLSGAVNIFYDPHYGVDAYHFDVIANILSQVRGWHVHHADHHVTPILAGSAVAASLLALCLAHNESHVYVVINAARRRSTIRARIMLKKAVARHPRLALRAVKRLQATTDVSFLTVAEYIAPLVETLVAGGYRHLASEALHLAGPDLSGLRRTVLMRIIETSDDPNKPDSSINTIHNTELVYDALYGRFVHLADARCALRKRSLIPVELYEMPFGRALGIEGELLLTCKMSTNDIVDTQARESCASSDCFLVSGDDPSNLHIKWQERYLCAEPGGAVLFDRLIANRWERFSSGDLSLGRTVSIRRAPHGD